MVISHDHRGNALGGCFRWLLFGYAAAGMLIVGVIYLWFRDDR